MNQETGASATIRTIGLQGIEPHPVDVTATVSRASGRMVALIQPSGGAAAEARFREMRVRLASALDRAGLSLEGSGNVTISATDQDGKPLDWQPHFDLAGALAVGVAAGHWTLPPPNRRFVGRLALDGSLEMVRGALPMALLAAGPGSTVFPRGNETELGFAWSDNWLARDLRSAALGEELEQPSMSSFEPIYGTTEYSQHQSLIAQHPQGRQVLDLALARKPVLLMGPPGSGRTMIARAVAGLLPFDKSALMTAAKIHSAAGLAERAVLSYSKPPFRAPHHSVSQAGLVGGGIHRPGEVSLAHGGLLFLDELPEFQRSALDALLKAWRTGTAQIRDARFPAYPRALIASANPCPCGYAGHPRRECHCSSDAVQRYQRRLGGIEEAFGFTRVQFEPLTVAALAAN